MQDKILLVDDREDNLLSIETILELNSYKFVKASSGRQALKILLNEFDFALILMDVQMPNLNGFETASLIYEREKLRHIPIIFITAHSYGDEHIFTGYRVGAVDYIYKPINPQLLRTKVAVFIDLYRKNHRLLEQEKKLMIINRNLEMEIKERKASEERIRQLNHELLENIARLESANKELDRVAFMASHDLQEPLRKIRLFSDRLLVKQHAALDEDGKMCLTRIQHASSRMQSLIDDILNFSKINIDKDSFEKTDFNILVKEVITDMEEEVSTKNAKINIEQLPSLAVNAGLMRLLFRNLLNNSLKYSKPDVPPEITISAEMISLSANTGSTGNHYCRIFVIDNGIGFDQKYSEQIFGMFKRLHQHSQYEGTGIGLALCKKVVEQHNGFIAAKSTLNQGTTFIISLPLGLDRVPALQVG